MGDVTQLCRCKSGKDYGQTWADATDCPIHDAESSPVCKAVRDAYEKSVDEGVKFSVRAVVERDRFKDALDFMRGPSDSGPWIAVYREAGGGYEGLQAVARAALEEGRFDG